MDKLIVILGPTASGKTDLSIKLAQKYKGEIISADSRQVYTGLNIGSGKITKKEMLGIPHHLLDVANPKRKFTVAQFQTLALKKIKEIQSRNHVPFLVGGTGLYIQSVVDGLILPEVKPNAKLRKELNEKSTPELFNMLQKLDPARAKNIDKHNPRRLVRALEIVMSTKKPVPTLKRNTSLDSLLLGINPPQEKLKKAIHVRLEKRLKNGMVAEVKRLHKQGVSWKRLEELGLEYRYVAQYLQEKLTYQEMATMLEKEIWQFSKRQMTWFKKDHRIHWIKNQKEAEGLIKSFLKAA